MGYSLIKTHPNWVGNLGLPQVYGLLEAFNTLETKKAEAVKNQSSSSASSYTHKPIHGSHGKIGKKSFDSLQGLKGLPGVQHIKRNKK